MAKRTENGMVSLSTFASVARQFGVGFSVEFTDKASYAVIGGRVQEWRGCPFYVELLVRGAVSAGRVDHKLYDEFDTWFQLESLT